MDLVFVEPEGYWTLNGYDLREFPTGWILIEDENGNLKPIDPYIVEVEDKTKKESKNGVNLY